MVSINGKFDAINGKFEDFDPQKGCFLRLFLWNNGTKSYCKTRITDAFAQSEDIG
jgi:hypothetical protein